MDNRTNRPIRVPLSVRRGVYEAIKAARPGYADQTLASAQGEAAIEALGPFMESLVSDSSENPVTQPADDRDRLEDDRS